MKCHLRLPGVYIIRHVNSGMVYVGSAINLYRRLFVHTSHLRNGLHCNKHLQRAWDRDGASAFVFEVLLVCDKSELIFFEQRAIDGEERAWLSC